MANPLVVACPLGVWTLVASGVTEGAIYNMAPAVDFMQTYRMAGDPSPTHNNDAVLAFVDPNAPLIIATDEPVDVYLQPMDVAGNVRVDV